MSYYVTPKRALNLNDNNIIKILKITNIKEYFKDNDYGYNLNSFKMNGKLYFEYVKKRIFYNGNEEIIEISISNEKENEYHEEYNGTLICPDCGKANILVFKNKYKCLSCNYTGKEEDF